MLDLSKFDISLFCVSDSRTDQTSLAINHCMNLVHFKKCKLLSSKDRSSFSKLNDEIELIKIPPIKKLEDYSKFMLYNADDYVDTEYILIVQYDGIVFNTKGWSEEFLRYDYIGAPWPDRVVGNSGFCLMSKKMLSCTKGKKDIFKGEIFPDDVILCRRPHVKKFMEDSGIKYAPFETALKFSFESVTTNSSYFGIHNKSRVSKILYKKIHTESEPKKIISIPTRPTFNRTLQPRFRNTNLIRAARLKRIKK